MSTRTLLELNHDHASRMNSEKFVAALAEYLQRPSECAVRDLATYGVIVYGMCHANDRNTRGFRSFLSRRWFKVADFYGEQLD